MAENMYKVWEHIRNQAAAAPAKPSAASAPAPAPAVQTPAAQTPAAIAFPAPTPAAKPPPAPTPAAKPQEYDPKVEGYQKGLKYAGYDPGKIDGIMGDDTRNAIRKLQKACNVQVSGTMNSETQSALLGVITNRRTLEGSAVIMQNTPAMMKAAAEKEKAAAAKAEAEKKAAAAKAEAEKKAAAAKAEAEKAEMYRKNMAAAGFALPPDAAAQKAPDADEPSMRDRVYAAVEEKKKAAVAKAAYIEEQEKKLKAGDPTVDTRYVAAKVATHVKDGNFADDILDFVDDMTAPQRTAIHAGAEGLKQLEDKGLEKVNEISPTAAHYLEGSVELSKNSIDGIADVAEAMTKPFDVVTKQVDAYNKDGIVGAVKVNPASQLYEDYHKFEEAAINGDPKAARYAVHVAADVYGAEGIVKLGAGYVHPTAPEPIVAESGSLPETGVPPEGGLANESVPGPGETLDGHPVGPDYPNMRPPADPPAPAEPGPRETLDGHPVHPDYPENVPPAEPPPGEPIDPRGDTAEHHTGEPPPPTEEILAEDRQTNRITTEQDVTQERAPVDPYAPQSHPPVDPHANTREVPSAPPLDETPAEQVPDPTPAEEHPGEQPPAPVEQIDAPPEEAPPAEPEHQGPALAPGDGSVPVDKALDIMERQSEEVRGESAGNMQYRWNRRLGMPAEEPVPAALRDDGIIFVDVERLTADQNARFTAMDRQIHPNHYDPVPAEGPPDIHEAPQQLQDAEVAPSPADPMPPEEPPAEQPPAQEPGNPIGQDAPPVEEPPAEGRGDPEEPVPPEDPPSRRTKVSHPPPPPDPVQKMTIDQVVQEMANGNRRVRISPDHASHVQFWQDILGQDLPVPNAYRNGNYIIVDPESLSLEQQILFGQYLEGTG